jgi:hypothetical protein
MYTTNLTCTVVHVDEFFHGSSRLVGILNSLRKMLVVS